MEKVIVYTFNDCRCKCGLPIVYTPATAAARPPNWTIMPIAWQEYRELRCQCIEDAINEIAERLRNLDLWLPE